MRHLSRFYAVTMSSSLYRADIGEGSPSLLKIAKGRNIVEEGVKVGEKIEDGSMLAIAKFLLLFWPEKYGTVHPLVGFEREPAMVNICYWGRTTSSIVALFLNKKSASKCLGAENLQGCDVRWENETIRVLQRIGSNHPNCVISTAYPDLWLMSPSKW